LISITAAPPGGTTVVCRELLRHLSRWQTIPFWHGGASFPFFAIGGPRQPAGWLAGDFLLRNDD
jgi:hypothetical protein